MPLSIHIRNDPFWFENGMVVFPQAGGPCWIIDPGFPPQPQQMADLVKDQRLQPEAIMLTHGHADHIGGLDAVRSLLGPVPVYLGRPEWGALSDPRDNLSVLGGMPVTTAVSDPRDLAPGMILKLGDLEWRVLDVSGHSPGGRALYCAEENVVIVGDALFAGGVGRTDFPHSDAGRLLRNLRESLMTLPDATRVYPGHGPHTTIGHERLSNPYIVHGW